MLAEAEAILLDAAIVVPLWVPVDTGFVAAGVRGLPARRGWGLRSALDVVPFACAVGDDPAGGGGAAGAGGKRR